MVAHLPLEHNTCHLQFKEFILDHGFRRVVHGCLAPRQKFEAELSKFGRETLQRHTHSDPRPPAEPQILATHSALSSMDEYTDECNTPKIQSAFKSPSYEHLRLWGVFWVQPIIVTVSEKKAFKKVIKLQ